MLITHLVVDSGGFITNAPIREISENVYTVSQVVSEIKDKATKDRLQVLPYQLCIEDPPPEDISFVTEFSKKTGDYPSLSPTDLKLLALVVRLHRQYGKTALKEIEANSARWKIEGKCVEKGQGIVGFYYPQSKNNSSESDGAEEKSENEEQEDEVEDEESSDSTWIGPENLSSACEKMGSLEIEDKKFEIGCISTDFAIQNVLIQLGLPVISTNGLLIREARTFVLRCHACFQVTSIMTKKFCPRCGNQTLKRVSVTVGPEGQRKLHINFRRPINIRGKNQSLPMPKGGKHGNDPILCEDQPIAHNRPKKSTLSRVDALDPDYEARNSPFALHDVHSRAAQFRTHVKRKSRK